MPETGTERPVLERVLEAMGKETGLTARVLEWEPRFHWNTPVRPDALVEIDTPKQAEQFAVEVKNVDRFETLHQLRALWRDKPNRHSSSRRRTSPRKWRSAAETWTCTSPTPPETF